MLARYPRTSGIGSPPLRSTWTIAASSVTTSIRRRAASAHRRLPPPSRADQGRDRDRIEVPHGPAGLLLAQAEHLAPQHVAPVGDNVAGRLTQFPLRQSGEQPAVLPALY